jgi:hypothetical protein
LFVGMFRSFTGGTEARRDAPPRSVDGDAMPTVPALMAFESGGCRAPARLGCDGDGGLLVVVTDLSAKIGA